jgi:hypothetical protein
VHRNAAPAERPKNERRVVVRSGILGRSGCRHPVNSRRECSGPFTGR